jgi:PadR family transcriptional regulator, regulatory protein PadR
MANRPQRVTAPTLQVLAAFLSDLRRDDWYGRALSQHTGLGSGTVLQCLYRLEREYSWLESRWEDQETAAREGRPPRRFYKLTGLGQREVPDFLQQRMSGLLRLSPGEGTV